MPPAKPGITLVPHFHLWHSLSDPSTAVNKKKSAHPSRSVLQTQHLSEVYVGDDQFRSDQQDSLSIQCSCCKQMSMWGTFWKRPGCHSFWKMSSCMKDILAIQHPDLHLLPLCRATWRGHYALLLRMFGIGLNLNGLSHLVVQTQSCENWTTFERIRHVFSNSLCYVILIAV